ncbi:MAG: helix-turn-helix domain-containing protein [Candidatus Bathyarchaeota archaeon]|jgi:DNA-binding transcriptional ArsR family regulator|nr:MAG: helix-turn-helix domain-containing protein [Candidatus Bathyarchaeota archaeon]
MTRRISRTTCDTIEETREYHTRYLRAVNNPLRRRILRALRENGATVEDLQDELGMDPHFLRWHLDILERGLCIEKTVKGRKTAYRLTQEGRVVDWLE